MSSCAAAGSVGVSPTAAYRHFSGQGDLLDAAKQVAFDGMSRAIIRLLEAISEDGNPVDIAVRRFEASGKGYVRYALAEPGLFRAAFCRTPPGQDKPSLGDVAPYAMLTALLDRLVEVGHLDPALRPAAEAGAWSTVHGLSMLMIDGPFQRLDADQRDEVIDRTVAMVSRGLAGGPKARP